jgi:electron transfer flavoprotein beta subunit
VRVKRLSAKGYDLIEAPMPAVVSCTQALGAPRYPSLKGIMAARSREIAVRGLADLRPTDDGPLLSAEGWSTRVVAADPPPARGEGRVVRAPAPDAAREIADFLAARRLI